jgi:outer membrane cobalamin receptor
VRLVAVLLLLAAPGAAQPTARDGAGAGGAPRVAARAPALVNVSPASSERAQPSSRLVTLELRDAPIRAALREIARQAGVQLYYSEYVVPLDRRITVSVREASVDEALAAVLRGTQVRVRRTSEGQVLLVRAESARPARARREQGSVRGRVTDAGTGVPVVGATVEVQNTPLRATTGEDGSYRLVRVPDGAQVLVARRIGYAKMVRSITVTDGQQLEVNFALTESVSPLDQVVVTGTVTPTEVKAIPTPITVVTASEIEQAGVTRVDQLLRGLVPGMVAIDNGTHDQVLGLSSRGGTTLGQSYGGVPIKVYVDGIEVAFGHAISQLDPSSIDHIEITRGPQASTVYGAGAIEGVIQIFTKKGASATGRTEVNTQVAAGSLESRWADGGTLAQEHALSISGASGELSYRLGGTYSTLGEWAEEYDSKRAFYQAGARWTAALFSVELTAQYMNRDHALRPVQPYFVEQVRSDRWNTGNDAFFATPFYATDERNVGTYGVNLVVQPTGWWEHRLVLGRDGYYNPRLQTQPRQLTPADTTRSYAIFEVTKFSAAYNTTVTASLGRSVQSTITLGVDWADTDENFVSARQHADGSLMAGTHFILLREYANKGAFVQAQLGIADALFVTAGVRADGNDNFGDEYGTAISPRVGLSYTRGIAGATVKARGSYGKAIRAPLPFQKFGSKVGLPFSEQLDAINLGPEEQKGYDVGLEVFLGRRAAVQVSYYDQRVEDVISGLTLTEPGVVPSLHRFTNLGRIENTGWELQAMALLGQFSLTGTYSTFESTVRELAPQGTGGNIGQYQVGDRLLLVPRSSGGLRFSYNGPRTMITLGGAYIGSFRNYDFIAFNNARFGGAGPAQPARAYIIDYPSVMKWNVHVTQEVTRHLSAFVRVENIGNSYDTETDNLAAVRGRLTVAGARLKL